MTQINLHRTRTEQARGYRASWTHKPRHGAGDMRGLVRLLEGVTGCAARFCPLGGNAAPVHPPREARVAFCSAPGSSEDADRSRMVRRLRTWPTEMSAPATMSWRATAWCWREALAWRSTAELCSSLSGSSTAAFIRDSDCRRAAIAAVCALVGRVALRHWRRMSRRGPRPAAASERRDARGTHRVDFAVLLDSHVPPPAACNLPSKE